MLIGFRLMMREYEEVFLLEISFDVVEFFYNFIRLWWKVFVNNNFDFWVICNVFSWWFVCDDYYFGNVFIVDIGLGSMVFILISCIDYDDFYWWCFFFGDSCCCEVEVMLKLVKVGWGEVMLVIIILCIWLNVIF